MWKKNQFLLIVLALILLFGCSNTEKEPIRSLEDLNSPVMKVGVATGSASDFAAREVLPDAEFVDFVMVPDGYAALTAGKIDAFIFDRVNLEYFALNNPDTAVLEEGFGELAKACVGMKLGNTELCDQTNEILAQLRSDGTLADMEQRWLRSIEHEMPELQKPENPKGTLRMMTEGMLEPFNYMSENGVLIGFDVELGIRIAYALNMDIEIQTANFDALIPSLEAGKCDMIISEINATPERRESVLFSDPYLEIETGILVPSDRDNSRKASESAFFGRLGQKFTATFLTEQRWKLILNGLGVTLEISVLAFALATVWGGALLAMERSKVRILRGFSAVYQRIVSGMPMLVVLMLLYYIVFKGVDIPSVLVAVLGFGLYDGVGLSEVFRTGIDSVDKGEREAAAALGFKPCAVFRKIVLPQAVSHVFGLYKGQFVALVKSTSIVGYIAIQDLTKASDIIRSRTYDAFFPIIATAIIYFAVSWTLVALLSRIEVRLDPKKRERTLKGVVCK